MKIEVTRRLLKKAIEDGIVESEEVFMSQILIESRDFFNNFVEEEFGIDSGVKINFGEIEVKIVDDPVEEDGQDIPTQP